MTDDSPREVLSWTRVENLPPSLRAQYDAIQSERLARGEPLADVVMVRIDSTSLTYLAKTGEPTGVVPADARMAMMVVREQMVSAVAYEQAFITGVGVNPPDWSPPPQTHP